MLLSIFNNTFFIYIAISNFSGNFKCKFFHPFISIIPESPFKLGKFIIALKHCVHRSHAIPVFKRIWSNYSGVS